MAPTPEQQQAITEEGKNIIVSAGAGSGKTAVLTERAKRKVLEGTHVNELLVLTFTNASAKEMKDRIREAVKNTEGLESELDLIDGAYITTFDAFSLAVLKKYHTRLNITNNIKVTDEVAIDLKKKEILDEIFEENYLTPKKTFIKLIEDFCLKDDQELKDYILGAYKKIELKYDKTDFINNYFNIFNEEKVNKTIEEYINLIREKQAIVKNLIIKLNDYFDGDFVCEVEDSLSKFLKANTYDEFLNSMDYPSTRVPKNSPEEGKLIKGQIYAILKEIRTELLIFASEEEIRADLASTKDNTKEIINIISILDNRLDKYKRENDIFTYNDIARLSIKVIEENEDIRKDLTNSFKEIMIDEYQDTSDTQEKFISLISNNNVFMVGDVKQSIYRFRNANPYIFKNKYDTYRDTDLGVKIDLLKNFRSRNNVLDNINLLFDNIMDDDIGGADYKASHRMIFGNKVYEKECNKEQNYDLDIITYNKEDLGRISTSEEEAFIIGNDIKEKIESKYQIFDKSKKVLRDCKYNDFVILLDRGKDFNLYKKVFEYLHIPLSIEKDESLRKDNDILIIKNLLKLIISIKNKTFDNSFKYNFISIERSFLYRISDEEIYNYYIKNNYEDSTLYKDCLELSEYLDIETPSSFLRRVLDKTNYEMKLLSINNIKSNRVRIEYIYNLMKESASNGNTIEDFINYLDQIIEADYDLRFNVNSDSNNSAKIMTIHGSKGLEYPVCYFAGFTYQFNMNELREKIIFDNYLGLIIPKVNNYYKDTILKILLRKRLRKEEISERIRLFYVAVTRAKEKMVIVLPEIEEEKEVLDVVPSYEREKYTSFYSIIKSIYSNLLPYVKKTNVTGTKEYLNSSKTTHIDKVPTKIEVKDIDIKTHEIVEKHYSKESLRIVSKEEKKLMEYGTKIHELLEEIDFNNKGMIDTIEDEFIKEKIISFINSDLMKDYLDKEMYKEYEFVYNEDNTISHGIIDLLIEDKDKYIIIDYKLKNIEDLLYDKQLNGYRKYIENKTNKKCICFLYSIINGNYREIDYNEVV